MKISLGVTRIVFVFKSFVVKIPRPGIWSHFLKGLIGNIHEAQTWKWNSGKYESGKSYLLCPVVWAAWGGWILIMKRAEILTEDQFSKENIEPHMIWFDGDDKSNNYGYYKGRLVKVDYGELERVWGEDFKPKK